MVERHRLLEIETDAPAGDVDRGDTPLGIELPDRAYGPVRDVQRAIPLPKLDAVTHREPALLDTLHFKAPALLGIDDTDQAALELEPE